MGQVDKLLDAARGQVGVKEYPAGSNSVIYNTWYYGHPVSGTDYAWCAVFVLWCFMSAELLPLTWGTANDARRSVAEGARNWKLLAQSRGAWITGETVAANAAFPVPAGTLNQTSAPSGAAQYMAGDIVLFDWTGRGISHAGIVEAVGADGKTLTTIEGNTGDGSDGNGGEVMRRERDISVVAGAFRPAYSTADTGGDIGAGAPFPVPQHEQSDTISAGEAGSNLEDETMNYETFKEYMRQYENEKAVLGVSEYAAASWKKAGEYEIAPGKRFVDGSRPRAYITRQDVVELFNRAGVIK
jgi:hypothetical protein